MCVPSPSMLASNYFRILKSLQAFDAFEETSLEAHYQLLPIRQEGKETPQAATTDNSSRQTLWRQKAGG